MTDRALTGDDLHDLALVSFHGWRVVMNSRRHKKLLKRGEDIRWSEFYLGWIWKPQ